MEANLTVMDSLQRRVSNRCMAVNQEGCADFLGILRVESVV